ncbi:aminopeptidase P family protein, partial [bacterium]
MDIRIRKIQEYLQNNALDAFLVLTRLNRQYLSGFTGSAGVLFIQKPINGHTTASDRSMPIHRQIALFVDDRYLIRARKESELPVFSISEFATSPQPSPISEREPGGRVRLRIGIEDRITLRELKRLEKSLKARFIQTSDVVENFRAVKIAREIRMLEKCQTIIDKVLTAVKSWTITKMTEIELAQRIERTGKKLGAGAMAFESIVAFGPNAAAPHHLSGSAKIGKNNFLLLDFGVKIGEYHSDFTRTLFIGSPNKKQERVYNIVLEAQMRGIREIREGVRAEKVDSAVRGFIAQAGFGKHFTHNTGHGVGLEIHELPNFSPTSEDILKSNMVATVEPGIYIENWGGVRIE